MTKVILNQRRFILKEGTHRKKENHFGIKRHNYAIEGFIETVFDPFSFHFICDSFF